MTAPAITLPSGESIRLPGGYDPNELRLAGNCRFVANELIFAYCPETGTGLAWCRSPAPHWQMIQPVTREGFEDWARQYEEAQRVRLLEEIRGASQRLLDGSPP